MKVVAVQLGFVWFFLKGLDSRFLHSLLCLPARIGCSHLKAQGSKDFHITLHTIFLCQNHAYFILFAVTMGKHGNACSVRDNGFFHLFGHSL